ncbi:MAG: hypothetical protein E6J90_07105 [Deltaproteobacteria bacterium]|nr:MAG: hypothetical protein E6J90_07105 [Deltaproteobacteria bacterium]
MEPTSTPGPPGKLVVAHPDRRAQRTLQRLVGATLCPVEIVADQAALIAAVDRETIAIVDAGLAHATPGLREWPARAWIAVPGEGLAPADAAIVDALLAAGWGHVVAHPMPILAEDAETLSYTLGDARERDDAVTTLARDVIGVGLPDRVGSLVSVIADELLANALYLAPLDEHKQRYRASEARERRRPLHGRDVVTVRWATDARYLAVEVRDRWGTLEPARVAGRLISGKTASSSEGGLGLALAYACCNQFVIDLEPDVMTEVIALLDVRYKPTELCRSASFHTFVVDTPGET